MEGVTRSRIKDFHFHDLRHTFAIDMIANEARDITVQATLGHAHIETTGIYTHILDNNLRNALEILTKKDNS